MSHNERIVQTAHKIITYYSTTNSKYTLLLNYLSKWTASLNLNYTLKLAVLVGLCHEMLLNFYYCYCKLLQLTCHEKGWELCRISNIWFNQEILNSFLGLFTTSTQFDGVVRQCASCCFPGLNWTLYTHSLLLPRLRISKIIVWEYKGRRDIPRLDTLKIKQNVNNKDSSIEWQTINVTYWYQSLSTVWVLTSDHVNIPSLTVLKKGRETP